MPQNQISIEVVRRLSLTRHLFELSKQNLNTKNNLHLFTCINLLHDATEAFLLALIHYLDISVDQHTKYDKYIQLINDKLCEPLPYKTHLLSVNQARISSKHHSIQPERSECERLVNGLDLFFNEVTKDIFGSDFTSISAVDLLSETESKNYLIAAKSFLEEGDFEECILNSRKALYLEIDAFYDISSYKNGNEPKGLLSLISNAPIYALNKDYIEKNVQTPTDYIVLDHSKIDQELLIYGVNPVSFWNVWRLSPQLFKTSDGEWIVKEEITKIDPEYIQEHYQYIFSTCLDILLAIHETKRSRKFNRYRDKKQVTVKNIGTAVYKKADKTSEVVVRSSDELNTFVADYFISGLNNDGFYWHVTNFDENMYVHGFIHNDDLFVSD